MTQEERVKIGSTWLGIAEMNGRELPANALKLMIDAVSDLPFESILFAMHKWIQESKHPRHPLPAELRELANPKATDRAVATDLARRIDRAIANHGWNWEQGYVGENGNYWVANGKTFGSFKEAVIEELGAVGWHAICSRGGWMQIRNSANDMEEGQFIAQLRDQVESSLALASAGVDVSKISMPSLSAPQEGLRLVGNPVASLISRANGDRSL